jgi:hypothetical protein
VRVDAGTSRAIPASIADLLCMIKKDRRDLSIAEVIAAVRASGEVPADLRMPTSTVHRLLTRAGLMAREPGDPTSKDHRRFVFEAAGQMWMSDVMHGPTVVVDGTASTSPVRAHAPPQGRIALSARMATGAAGWSRSRVASSSKCSSSGSASLGRKMRTRVPWPGLESRKTLPPWWRTMP